MSAAQQMDMASSKPFTDALALPVWATPEADQIHAAGFGVAPSPHLLLRQEAKGLLLLTRQEPAPQRLLSWRPGGHIQAGPALDGISKAQVEELARINLRWAGLLSRDLLKRACRGDRDRLGKLGIMVMNTTRALSGGQDVARPDCACRLTHLPPRGVHPTGHAVHCPHMAEAERVWQLRSETGRALQYKGEAPDIRWISGALARWRADGCLYLPAGAMVHLSSGQVVCIHSCGAEFGRFEDEFEAARWLWWLARVSTGAPLARQPTGYRQPAAAWVYDKMVTGNGQRITRALVQGRDPDWPPELLVFVDDQRAVWDIRQRQYSPRRDRNHVELLSASGWTSPPIPPMAAPTQKQRRESLHSRLFVKR